MSKERYERLETYLFEESGPCNTDAALEIARRRAVKQGIHHIIASSSRGVTARKLLTIFPEDEYNLVVCTLPSVKPTLTGLYRAMKDVTNSLKTLQLELNANGTDQIEYGVPPDLAGHPRLKFVTDNFDKIGQTVFAGTPGSLSRAQFFKGQADIVKGEAFVIQTLWRFSQGTKVAVQSALCAVNAGLVPPGVEAVAMGGHLLGIDTVLVVRTAKPEDFFAVDGGFAVLEVLAKPRLSVLW